MSRPSELLTVDGHRFDKFHLVEHVDDNAGFCAMVTYALNGVRKAIENNWLPVVNFDGRTARFFYEPERGENVWEYYFQPVMEPGWATVGPLIRSGQIPASLVHRYEESLFLSWHHDDPDRLATFWAKDVPKDPVAWMAAKRALGREYVGKFIEVQPHILEIVDRFVDAHLREQYAYGVHIRGTDFAYAAPTRPERVIETIRELSAREGRSEFSVFVATDQEQYVELFRDAFGEHVVTYEAVRSSSDVPPFKFEDVSPYRKGEDVLVDLLLLSRCNHVLKGAAAVGEYALWFNPALEFTDFALESRFDPRDGPYLKSAYLKLNVGGYSRSKWVAVRVWEAIVPWVRIPWRFLVRLRRYLRRRWAR